jgi:hypothetical protein
MLAEIELYFPASETEGEHMTVTPVEVSCNTELANLAYQMQMQTGYRLRIEKKLDGRVKTHVVGLRAEHVSFGPVIARDKNGLPDYDTKRRP